MSFAIQNQIEAVCLANLSNKTPCYLLTETCYYLENQVFGVFINRDMTLIKTSFCSRLYSTSLTFWQTVVWKYAHAKVRSSRLKVLCVNVVHEHLHYTDLNHSAVEQYNRRSHSGGTAATAVSKVLEKKSHCWLFLRNSPDIWVGFFLLGSLDFMNVMNKKLQLCERPTVHVVHYTK